MSELQNDYDKNSNIILKYIFTSDDPADNLIKPLGDILYSRYSNTLLSKQPPDYCYKHL